jgi:hypothetical protein
VDLTFSRRKGIPCFYFGHCNNWRVKRKGAHRACNIDERAGGAGHARPRQARRRDATTQAASESRLKWAGPGSQRLAGWLAR